MKARARKPSPVYLPAAKWGEYRRARSGEYRKTRLAPFDWMLPAIPKKEAKPKNPICPKCHGDTVKNGWTNTDWAAQIQRYRCKECDHSFTSKDIKTKTKEAKKPEAVKQKSIVKTLNELKLEKEVKDLKTEIYKKNVQISNLKSKIQKLQNAIETEKKIEEDRTRFIQENADFLEIV